MNQERLSVHRVVALRVPRTRFRGMAHGCCWFRNYFCRKSLVAVQKDLDSDVDLGGLKRFSFQELLIATGGFDSKSLLARGSYGNTYKGLLEDGSRVCIKRLKREELQFRSEVEVNATVCHPNIVRLCGVCITTSEMLLVYSFIANETVASWLVGRPCHQSPLSWPTRKHIAMDSARGISYLHHRNPKVVHLDIKPSNIFLDEDFRAVVGGLGLAKELDSETDEASRICGTFGYMAPEYICTGRFSLKTDVYAYGMTLLEIITGQTPSVLSQLANGVDLIMHDWLKEHVRDNNLELLVDPDLRGDYAEAELEELFQIALICTHDFPGTRPTMPEVVRLLEGDGLEERWNEYKNTELRSNQLGASHRHSPRWSIDSAYGLCAEDLPSPR